MTEIMKRKKGQILNNNERQLILNLISYLREKDSDKSLSEVIREISKATGCSERTIYKIRKDASKGITVSANRTRVRKKENKNSRNVKYDSFIKSAIRKKVYNFFLENIPPTLNTILCLVNNDPDLPNFKRSTLHTLLKEIGFVYAQKGKKSLLTEEEELVKLRREYLENIRKFRSENRWIVYTGETVISIMKKEIKKFEGESTKHDNIVEERVEAIPITCETVNTVLVNANELIPGTALVYTIDATALMNIQVQEVQCNSDNIPIHRISTNDCILISEPTQTLTIEENKTDQTPTNSKKPFPERELRLTVMHAGSSNGFVVGADFITLSKKKNEEIDSYEYWFTEKLLPKIPPNSVIVTDNNAPYHKLREENIPEGTWKKQQIKNWLSSRNINVAHINQKKELLAVVNSVRPFYSTKHKLDKVAKEKGVIIISLPPYHYELNPLNMVWAQVKYHVRSNIKSFKVKKIKELIREGFCNITQVNWMNYIHHVKQMEDLLWSVDEIHENNQNVEFRQKESDF